MSIFTGMFRSRDKPQNRTAGSSYSFFFGGSTSGKTVTERTAMQMTAVYSCVRILAEAVAGLPLNLYHYLPDGGKEKSYDHPLYRLLHDEPKGDVTVKIDGIAASAASVIAMAGTKVLMAPTALMMIHNPLTVAIGDSEEMQKAIAMLSEVKESIINAYEIKTGQSRAKLSHLMDAETWMNANKAIEYGFADGILEDKKSPSDVVVSFAFSRRAVTNSLMSKLTAKQKANKPAAPERSVNELMERLNLMKY